MGSSFIEAGAKEGIGLDVGEVHIWCAPLDVSSSHTDVLWVLSPDECERAERFYFEDDRKRFVAARVFLRHTLSLYLHCDPASLRFSYGTHGKPHLECDLRFNLSHSGGLAVVAVALGREIGIDIEKLRNGFSFNELAQRFFSPYEAALIRSLPDEPKMREFFRLWTRKEAYMKALGIGISLPHARLDLSLESDGEGLLLGGGVNSTLWRIEDFTPAPGYVGAVATEGEGFRVKVLHWAEGLV